MSARPKRQMRRPGLPSSLRDGEGDVALLLSGVERDRDLEHTKFMHLLGRLHVNEDFNDATAAKSVYK